MSPVIIYLCVSHAAVPPKPRDKLEWHVDTWVDGVVSCWVAIVLTTYRVFAPLPT